MKSIVITVFPLVFLSLFFAATLLAHHSFMGEYDLTASVTLRGIVTKVDWSNPHDHPDPCFIALANSGGNGRPDRILQTYQPEEFEGQLFL